MATPNTRRASLAVADREVCVTDLLARAAAFARRVSDAKRTLDAGFEWYPYDTLSALWHLDKLLTGERRGLLAGRRRGLGLGGEDGGLGFFLESLGYDVIAADHPAYNHNGMRGIRALKT